MKKHHLYNYLQQASDNLKSDYQAIRAHSRDDPGTAGDQGEEDWAGVLRRWLPPEYRVVTKGRIIPEHGAPSRQVDVLVLKPGYPTALNGMKLYLGGGVAWAFECKVTLRARDLGSIWATCKSIKERSSVNFERSPYRCLHSGIRFGVLAHSSDFSERGAADALEEKLIACELSDVGHPSMGVDVVCVADLATWSSAVQLNPHPTMQGGGLPEVGSSLVRHPAAKRTLNKEGSVSRSNRLLESSEETPESFGLPLASAWAKIYISLAYENPMLQDIGNYLHFSFISGEGEGRVRGWPYSVLPEDVVEDIRRGRCWGNFDQFSHWNFQFF